MSMTLMFHHVTVNRLMQCGLGVNNPKTAMYGVKLLAEAVVTSALF